MSAIRAFVLEENKQISLTLTWICHSSPAPPPPQNKGWSDFVAWLQIWANPKEFSLIAKLQKNCFRLQNTDMRERMRKRRVRDDMTSRRFRDDMRERRDDFPEHLWQLCFYNVLSKICASPPQNFFCGGWLATQKDGVYENMFSRTLSGHFCRHAQVLRSPKPPKSKT